MSDGIICLRQNRRTQALFSHFQNRSDERKLIPPLRRCSTRFVRYPPRPKNRDVDPPEKQVRPLRWSATKIIRRKLIKIRFSNFEDGRFWGGHLGRGWECLAAPFALQLGAVQAQQIARPMNETKNADTATWDWAAGSEFSCSQCSQPIMPFRKTLSKIGNSGVLFSISCNPYKLFMKRFVLLTDV